MITQTVKLDDNMIDTMIILINKEKDRMTLANKILAMDYDYPKYSDDEIKYLIAIKNQLMNPEV